MGDCFVLDLYGGPGGWEVAAGMLGISRIAGIEWDAAACRTRAAAGHLTVRADVSQMPAEPLAGRVTGLIASPPCQTFSMAGKRGGAAVTGELAAAIEDAFACRKTRAARRRAMAARLRAAWWPSPKLTRVQRSAKIRPAVLSASQVIEPARFIRACQPEWVALEQVPGVLPLWQVYAAELRKMGYSAWCGKLNAADYGVPQTRERAILIASRVRRADRPVPTHYDPRKGGQLWGEPWVSMADALGWGATGRAAPTVTAGGTATGGAEPFGHRDRDMLAREITEGRWALRKDAQANAATRPAPAPAPAPAPTISFGHAASSMQWVLHTNRGQAEDGSRQTRDPRSAPAPALTAKSGNQWNVKFRNNNNNACTRSPDEPAGTLFFGGRSNWAAFTDGQQSIRITVQEAAILQSFPPDYPWQGTKTAQFTQIGNAVPPLLAAHVLAMATGIGIGRQAA